MENRLYVSIIVLLSLEAVYMVQATFVQKIYKIIEPGENFTGKIGAELIVDSKIECSIK